MQDEAAPHIALLFDPRLESTEHGHQPARGKIKMTLSSAVILLAITLQVTACGQTPNGTNVSSTDSTPNNGQPAVPIKRPAAEGKAQDAPQPPASLSIELANELGVKATVHVTEFTAGKEKESNNDHDFITTELNYMGGEWPAQPSNGGNGDFANTRLVIETVEQKVFVLVPWQAFKSLSVKDGAQLLTLNDGTKYKGKLRTILKDRAGRDERIYQLSGALSMTIAQMPTQATRSSVNGTTATAKGRLWEVTGWGGPALMITQPRFVFSMFVVTSGGGIYAEHGYYATKVSEQFGVDTHNSGNSTSATISNFERISIGGGKDAFGMPVQVNARDADAVSGELAATPFGLEAHANEYLNRSREVAGDLPNGCTIVFSVWRNGDRPLKIERSHDN